MEQPVNLAAAPHRKRLRRDDVPADKQRVSISSCHGIMRRSRQDAPMRVLNECSVDATAAGA